MLFITSGLALRSDWEELDEARGRRLQGNTQDTINTQDSVNPKISLSLNFYDK